ncbi:MAG: lipopolysaccharide biosynthesis protein [Chloroflexi bacterium]|nr:lipopolysaccharide biosynthesis protein [Chloroflexota bacterium]
MKENVVEATEPTTGKKLARQVSRGGLLMFALKGTENALAFIRIFILARLLLPEHFGQMGIALLVLSVLDTFSMTGFNIALIQRKAAKPYLDTAWTVQILRGMLLFLLLILVSNPIAQLFNEPTVKTLIRLLSVRVLVQGFYNTGILFFQKELEFSKHFAYLVIMSVTEFVVTIVVALVTKDAWALVWGSVAGAIAGLIASYWTHPYRPHLQFDKAKAKEMFQFGRWVLSGSSLLFLFMNGDDFLVAKLLGAASLGLYQTAYRFSNLPTSLIADAIAEVTFPAFSKLQDNIPVLRDAYLQVLQLIVFISAPLAGVIFFFSTDFILLFLGEKWLPMARALQLLALWGFTRPISKMAGTAFYALGRPDLTTKLVFARLILLAALIWPLTMHRNIEGTALAVVLSVVLVDPFAQVGMIRLTGLGVRPLVKVILLPVINTLIVIGILALCRFFILKTVGFAGFIFLVLIGILVYLATSYLSDQYLDYGIQRTIRDRLEAL